MSLSKISQDVILELLKFVWLVTSHNVLSKYLLFWGYVVLKTRNLKVEPKLTLEYLIVELQQVNKQKALIRMRKSVACHNWGDSRKEKLTFYYLLNSCRQIFNLGMRELVVIRDTFVVNFSEWLHLRTGTCRAEVAYVFVKAGSQKQKDCKKWKSLTVLVQMHNGSQPRVVLRIYFIHCLHHFISLFLEQTNHLLIYWARRINRIKKLLSHLFL